MSNSLSRTYKIVLMSILAALVIILQVFFSNISIGMFKITLTLIPIVVGAIILGPGYGAVLGLIFGVIVSIFSITGVDAGGYMVFSANPVMAWLLCLIKGAAAGFFPALIYRALAKKNENVAAFVAAISAPIANTGIFIAGILLFFRSVFDSWMNGSGYTNPLTYIIVGLCGINFLIEFAVAVIFSPAVAIVIKSFKKVH